jgi:hypothetical protein
MVRVKFRDLSISLSLFLTHPLSLSLSFSTEITGNNVNPEKFDFVLQEYCDRKKDETGGV